MIRTITGEQFRYLWHAAGGDVLKRPLQVAGGTRTRAEVRQRDEALAGWWADHEDAGLFSAVRTLRRPTTWLESTAFEADGRPHRGLLAVGDHRSTLVLQNAIRTGDRGRGSQECGGWSRESGGDCRIETGHANELVAVLVRTLPDFRAGDVGPLHAGVENIEAGRAPLGDDAWFGGPVTVSAAERIRALADRPRECEGEFVLSSPAGGMPGEHQRVRLPWIVSRAGGHLFDGVGTRAAADDGSAVRGLGVTARQRRTGDVRVRPVGRDDMVAAVRALLAEGGL